MSIYNVLKEGYVPKPRWWHRADECLPVMTHVTNVFDGLSRSPEVLVYVKTSEPFYSVAKLTQWGHELKPTWLLDIDEADVSDIPSSTIYWRWLPMPP